MIFRPSGFWRRPARIWNQNAGALKFDRSGALIYSSASYAPIVYSSGRSM